MNKGIYVVGNKVDIPNPCNISQHNCENVLLFIGKMNYEPNVVAVTSFIQNVFPNLLKSHPKLRFMIVGAHPDARVKKLANGNNIIVTGFVDSLEPYFQQATIVIAPMLTGAGIQNKIIQAMSYACCVATTPIGAEGLHINKGEIAVWKSVNEWIVGINELLVKRDMRKNMGMKARQYVIDNLSTAIVEKQFWEFIENANKSQSSNKYGL